MTESEQAVREYPYKDGDHTIIGPECFATEDEQMICWKGENYVRQESPEDRDEE